MSSVTLYHGNKQDEISRKLLNWYDVHHRSFPWRINPENIKKGETINPYYVWLSEIMLQQTRTDVVQKYFTKFITIWPTLETLANADIEDIMKAWAGLGYYTRAQSLSKCAKRIMQEYNGIFPKEEKILQKLPGIGAYTAGAICSIAFNQPCVAIDGNIRKVISRLFAIEPMTQENKEINIFAENILCKKRPGDFIQAMMDLASLVCLSKKPHCPVCPLQENCKAFSLGTPDIFPAKYPKKIKPKRFGSIFIARRSCDGAILMKKRIGSNLLRGMTEFPTTNWQEEEKIEELPFPAHWIYCKEIQHSFSHFSLYLRVYFAEISDDPSSFIEKSFWSLHPEKEALPSVMKKALLCCSFR